MSKSQTAKTGLGDGLNLVFRSKFEPISARFSLFGGGKNRLLRNNSATFPLFTLSVRNTPPFLCAPPLRLISMTGRCHDLCLGYR